MSTKQRWFEPGGKVFRRALLHEEAMARALGLLDQGLAPDAFRGLCALLDRVAYGAETQGDGPLSAGDMQALERAVLEQASADDALEGWIAELLPQAHTRFELEALAAHVRAVAIKAHEIAALRRANQEVES